jgi:hypothetical protein
MSTPYCVALGQAGVPLDDVTVRVETITRRVLAKRCRQKGGKAILASWDDAILWQEDTVQQCRLFALESLQVADRHTVTVVTEEGTVKQNPLTEEVYKVAWCSKYVSWRLLQWLVKQHSSISRQIQKEHGDIIVTVDAIANKQQYHGTSNIDLKIDMERTLTPPQRRAYYALLLGLDRRQAKINADTYSLARARIASYLCE